MSAHHNVVAEHSAFEIIPKGRLMPEPNRADKGAIDRASQAMALRWLYKSAALITLTQLMRNCADRTREMFTWRDLIKASIDSSDKSAAKPTRRQLERTIELLERAGVVIEAHRGRNNERTWRIPSLVYRCTAHPQPPENFWELKADLNRIQGRERNRTYRRGQATAKVIRLAKSDKPNFSKTDTIAKTTENSAPKKNVTRLIRPSEPATDGPTRTLNEAEILAVDLDIEAQDRALREKEAKSASGSCA